MPFTSDAVPEPLLPGRLIGGFAHAPVMTAARLAAHTSRTTARRRAGILRDYVARFGSGSTADGRQVPLAARVPGPIPSREGEHGIEQPGGEAPDEQPAGVEAGPEPPGR